MTTPTNSTIRILLVDDHTLFRSGIKALLARQADLEVVGEASEAVAGAHLAKSLRPDVVLLDLHMPGATGVEALRLIHAGASEAHVVMLTVSEDADDLLECLRAGAQGYLLKNIDTGFLLESIRRAADGESVMSPQMTAKLMASVRCAPAPVQGEAEIGRDREQGRLSPREREIMALLARGASNKELARSLDLAESTVKIHVQNILKKLKLTSRVQAAVYAVEHGLATREGA